MKEPIKVLIADDDRMLVEMYKERLELAGYIVIACDNGEKAIKEARDNKPNLVLLDIMMPRVDGYQVLASLKSDVNTKDIPVVMLTALVRDLNKSQAMKLGATDYIVKSEIMPGQVIDKVKETLEKNTTSKKVLNGLFHPKKNIESSPFEEIPQTKLKTQTEVMFAPPEMPREKKIKIILISLSTIILLVFIIYVLFL